MEEQKIVIHADPDLADDIPWYLGQVEEYTEAIEKAMGDNDFETIEDAGHRMKGSGESFGFDTVSKMGKSIEMAAKEKDLDEIRKKVEALARYIKMVEVVLRIVIASRMRYETQKAWRDTSGSRIGQRGSD